MRKLLPVLPILLSGLAATPAPAAPAADLTSILSATPFNLRTTTKAAGAPVHVILGWEPDGKVSLRLLADDGKDLLLASASTSKDAFLALLSRPGERLVLKGAAADVTVTNRTAVTFADESSGSRSLRGGFTLEGASLPSGMSRDLSLALTIGLLSYNAEKLWDNNPANSSWYIDKAQFDDFSPVLSNYYDKSTQEAKARNFARVLRLAGLPEVVAIQEVESGENTSTLLKPGSPFREELEALGYRSFALGEQEKENPVTETTAFVSRLALDMSVGSVRISPNAEGFEKRRRKDKMHFAKAAMRDIQVVEVPLGGQRLRIYNNHWKAQGDESADALREVTAEILSEEIKKARKANPSLDIVVLGDLNVDYSDRDPSLKLLGATGDERDMLDDDSDTLYNAWFELPPEQRWERTYNGKLITLSHILLSSPLYDRRGFQIVDNSFRVIGHTQPARRVLVNADGAPLRWQSREVPPAELPPELRTRVEAETAKRAQVCKSDADRHAKFRCDALFVQHLGIGYSDHLGLMVQLNWVGDAGNKPMDIQPSSTDRHGDGTQFDEIIEECNPKDLAAIPDVRTLPNPTDPELLGSCVKIDARTAPLPITQIGDYNNTAIMLGKEPLRINMARAFDDRPIENGKPVADKRGKGFRRSNKCISRDVLACTERRPEEKGRCALPPGRIKFALGRLGYMHGYLTLVVAQREFLELTDLPEFKRTACDWN